MRLRAVARKIRDEVVNSWRSIQLRTALRSLETVLRTGATPRAQLVARLARGWGNESWSASLQLLTAILHWLPRTSGPILECGSGLSTLLLAVAAAASGRRVISLEHDSEWAKRALDALPSHLRSSVQIFVAPIESHGEFDWYAVNPSAIPASIGLVVCDGPPGSTRGGRYGLAPVLASRMGAGCIVLLDDTQRPGEHEIVQRWCTELEATVMGERDTYTVIRVEHSQGVERTSIADHEALTCQPTATSSGRSIAVSPSQTTRHSPVTRLRILALAPNDWHGMWMNRQQLLSRLGARQPILYSTGARSIWDKELMVRGRGGLFGQFEARDGVCIDHAPLFPLRVPSAALLDRAALKLIVRRWRRQLSRYGSDPLVAYLFHPDYEVFLDALRPDHVVYHAYDLLSRSPSWTLDSEARQARLLARAELIIASSKVIAEELRERSGRAVHLVPNGVDFEAFSRIDGTPEPADLAALPRPRIAHVGRLNRKIDIDLIIELARKHPLWSFVLIGPVVDLDMSDTRRFETASGVANIHMLGVKTRHELPRYMAAIDVGLLAYRTGVLWTEGIYPLKLHEYLACGLPIVSADIPAVRDFTEVVRTATSLGDWSTCIQAALADTSPERSALRVRIARENSWTTRAETISELLETLIESPAPHRRTDSALA